MKLLEAAKALADGAYPMDDMDHCWHCGAMHRFDHKPACPWLMLPQIVAALEAADELAAFVLHERGWQYPSYGPGVPDDKVAAYRYNQIAHPKVVPPS